MHAGGERAWRQPLLDAVMYLASAVRAAGFSGALRRRMSPELLAGQPFRQLGRTVERVRDCADAGDNAALLKEAHYLRALLDACRQAALSVTEHLEDYGVSVDLVFQVDQLSRRARRLDELLTCVLSPHPAREVAHLLAGLVRVSRESRSVRGLLASHYSLLARKVAERSAERGEHYITRDRAEWHRMLGAAAGGGAVLSVTTLLKFALLGLGLSAFWSGLAAGLNYAASFVLIQLMHFTVATKQPAMTAPAMAHKLSGVSASLVEATRGAAPDAAQRAADDVELRGFVDEVAHLIRSQLAGILGNLALVVPVVLVAQLLWRLSFGAPLVGHATAAAHGRDALAARADRLLRRLHRRAAVRQQPDRRLGRELVRLAPARQRAGLEPAHRRPPRRRARAALGRLVAAQRLGAGVERLARPDARAGAAGGGVLRPAARRAPRDAVDRPARRRARHARARRCWRRLRSGGASPASRPPARSTWR